MRLLVCGSRDWSSAWEDVGQHMRVDGDGLPDGELVTVIHGGCPTGADRIADFVARGCGHKVEAYPVTLSLDGPWPAAGPRRNARMLREGKPTHGLAFGALYRESNGNGAITASRARTGTGDMVKRMLGAGLPVRWVATPGADAVNLREMPEPPTEKA